MKRANNFEIAEIQPQGAFCLAFASFFCQFQPSAAYKYVAYKKTCNTSIWCLYFRL